MSAKHSALVVSVGVAIFSMFFGAGNVVFPLLLGQQAGDQVGMALFGVILTAVGAPLLGLFGCVLFSGDCKAFFYRIGSIPGFILVCLLMALLGPIGVMPRCFTVAYGAVHPYFPSLSLAAFSVMAGLLTLGLIAKRRLVLPILGNVLSPLLIMLLGVIVFIGLADMPSLPASQFTAMAAFKEGLTAGYFMMDLLAALFFAVSIWMLLQEKWHTKTDHLQDPALMRVYIKASLIGGLLLALVYLGLSICAAAFGDVIAQARPEQALSALAIHLLGPKLALGANCAIALACLTTVMGLTVAIGDVIHVEMEGTIVAKKLRYRYDVMIISIIAITVLFSNLGFKGIMSFLNPIVSLVYPAIIVLTICNIAYRLWGFSYVKGPFYATLAITLLLTVKPAFAAPELLEFTIEGTQIAPVLEPKDISLKPDHEYVFMVKNNQDVSLILQYGAFGQTVTTAFLQGTTHVTQEGIMLLPQTRVMWHFYTTAEGEYPFFVSNPGMNIAGETGKIMVALPKPVETAEKSNTSAKNDKAKSAAEETSAAWIRRRFTNR